MDDGTNTKQLKTIATYTFGQTVCEIRATHELTDEDIKRFNKTSKYYNLVKKKRGCNEEKGDPSNDTTEIGVNDREDK